METRSNFIAMMMLGAAIVALFGTVVSNEIFHSERPKKMGYVVEGVVADGGSEAAAPEVPIASLLPTADVAKGEEVFKKCASCHNVNQGGANGIGPNLYAIVGEAVAQGRGGYLFSDSLKGVGGKWTFDALNHWLASPKAMAAGTKMSFAGLSKPEDRADVIAYLNKQGSNLPYPPAPKADASAAAPAAGGAPDNAATAAPAAVNAETKPAAAAPVAVTAAPGEAKN